MHGRGRVGKGGKESEIGESVRVRTGRWERDERESERVKAEDYEICAIDGARKKINNMVRNLRKNTAT